jgi:predicted house-cleaning noncanonical NTP pyrophosphatase (MazG superfamily)
MQAGIGAAAVYVLEDPAEISRLIHGDESPALRSDLADLVTVPVVVRTDLNTKEQQADLPRSDPLPTVDEVVAYIRTRAREFRSQGYLTDQFCFLLHRFIPARAGAWSFFSPGAPRVRIDSSWGSPESLEFFPHDSFELSITGDHVIKRKLRCKEQYIGTSPEGGWCDVISGRPYDWRASLTPRQLEAISQGTVAVASVAKSAVAIMWFVDIPSSLGHPDPLPWLITLNPVVHSSEAAKLLPSGELPVVTCERDFNQLKMSKHVPPRRLLYRPNATSTRDVELHKRLAQWAKESDIAVLLEGSLLGHAYYIISRVARVLAVDPFTQKFGRQEFDKLVRDLIPIKIRKAGGVPVVVQLNVTEFLHLLKQKMVEESLEFFASFEKQTSLEEIADILEVAYAAAEALGADEPGLLSLVRKKRAERGGFRDRLLLLETSEQSVLHLHQLSRESDNEVEPPARTRLRQPVSSTRPGELTISLIPESGSFTTLLGSESHDSEQEVVVRYDEKSVTVLFRDAPFAPSPTQPSLFDSD